MDIVEESYILIRLISKSSSLVRVIKVNKLVDHCVLSMNWSVCPFPFTLVITIISKKFYSSGCYVNLASIIPSLNLIPHGRTCRTSDRSVNDVIADKNVVTKIKSKSTGLQHIGFNGFAKRHWKTGYYPFAYGWCLGLC